MIIIDRFEGNIAVLETDVGMINVDRKLIPEGSAEGDVLRCENGVYVSDRESTETRRAAVLEKFNKLRRRGND